MNKTQIVAKVLDDMGISQDRMFKVDLNRKFTSDMENNMDERSRTEQHYSRLLRSLNPHVFDEAHIPTATTIDASNFSAECKKIQDRLIRAATFGIRYGNPDIQSAIRKDHNGVDADQLLHQKNVQQFFGALQPFKRKLTVCAYLDDLGFFPKPEHITPTFGMALRGFVANETKVGRIVYHDRESWFKERMPVVEVEKPKQIPYFKKTNLSYWLRRAFGNGF